MPVKYNSVPLFIGLAIVQTAMATMVWHKLFLSRQIQADYPGALQATGYHPPSMVFAVGITAHAVVCWAVACLRVWRRERAEKTNYNTQKDRCL